MLSIYLKDRPIQEKFKDDLVLLFEKHKPVDFKLTFDADMTPILSRKEMIKQEDFESFLNDFSDMYEEYYPLFYMVTVSAKGWYDSFSIMHSYCVDGVYY